VACPNETLPDCFVRIRLGKWSVTWLFCENQIVKVKFCQFKLWILYYASEGLSGKLFRLGMCLSSTLTVVKLLYQPKSSQLVYFLQPLKVLPSFAYHLGKPYKRWAMLPFMPQWSHHTWVRVIWIFSTRMYTLMCIRFLLGMSIASLCGPLGSNSAWQWSLKTILILLRIAPLTALTFNWKQQRSKLYLMINSRLEDPFLPPRTKSDSLAMKREHDNIRQHRQI